MIRTIFRKTATTLLFATVLYAQSTADFDSKVQTILQTKTTQKRVTLMNKLKRQIATLSPQERRAIIEHVATRLTYQSNSAQTAHTPSPFMRRRKHIFSQQIAADDAMRYSHKRVEEESAHAWMRHEGLDLEGTPHTPQETYDDVYERDEEPEPLHFRP